MKHLDRSLVICAMAEGMDKVELRRTQKEKRRHVDSFQTPEKGCQEDEGREDLPYMWNTEDDG